ncbi:MAG TPA: TerC family protein [Usitatibacteraceae bacterium]|jgi:predicted tellurium resistance membrane protein TerC|nr:TerC family protein [Usitatibacteraceae bacterium]
MEFLTFAWVTNPEIWLSLVTLSALEIVLGIDNLVFIAILTGRLPAHQRALGRRVGLALALITRLMLLATLAWIVGLVEPVFSVAGKAFSWRDIILIAGGLFLLWKATVEIHEMVEKEEDEPDRPQGAAGVTFRGVVLQIAVIDIIFSLDSVITAVGMADQLWVMVTAVVIAMIIMIIAANPLAEFVSSYPTIKMLALAFLLLIGVILIADGLGLHVPKGYIYFALAFSVAVETLNHFVRRRRRRLKGA